MAKQNQETAEALTALVRNDNQTTGLRRATISVNMKLGNSANDDSASSGEIQLTILKDPRDVKFCVPDQNWWTRWCGDQHGQSGGG